MQGNLHRHEFLELLYVQRGSLTNRFVGSEAVMAAGDVIILKPYVRHVLEVEEGERPMLAYCCSFLPNIVDSGIRCMDDAVRAHPGNRHFFQSFLALAGESVSAVRFSIPEEERKKFEKRLKGLKRLALASDAGNHALLRCEFLRLLAFLSDFREQGQEIQAGSAMPVSQYRPKLEKTLNHIHDHASEALSLKEMAAMCGTSSTYFCQLFKRETGMTFLEYLTDLRIQNACDLLRDGNEAVSEVCYRVGFGDYSNFSRQFKKARGISAAEYRRQRG